MLVFIHICIKHSKYQEMRKTIAIKFYEKLQGKLIFLQLTKNLKMFYNVLFHWPKWASAQKVKLHHCDSFNRILRLTLVAKNL